MTIREALAKRIPRVRHAKWADSASYLRLPLLPDGTAGPWAELYEAGTQLVLGIRPGSQRICVLLPGVLEGQDWEAYTGPPSGWEQAERNYARTYAET